MAQEYWIYKGSSCHFDHIELDFDYIELDDESGGMVKIKPCGFYDGVSLSDSIEGGIHVIEYFEYERIKAENARYREALEFAIDMLKAFQPWATVYGLNYDCDKTLEKAREALKGE